MWIQAKGKHCNINTKVEFKAKQNYIGQILF